MNEEGIKELVAQYLRDKLIVQVHHQRESTYENETIKVEIYLGGEIITECLEYM